MKKILSNKYVYIPVLILMIIVLISIVTGNGETPFEQVAVKRGVLVQEVSLTGTVVPVNAVDISFENSGRVVSVPVDVGDKVARGQVLVSLDTTSLVLDLREAESVLASDEATLLRQKRGTRPEDLAVLQSKYDAAVIAFSDAKSTLINSIKGAYTRADDAVRNYGDQFFDNEKSGSPDLNVVISDSQLEIDLNNGRVNMEKILNLWQQEADSLIVSSNLTDLTERSRQNLDAVLSFLNKLSMAINSLTVSQSLSQTTLSGYRADVSAARTSVNTAISTLSTAIEGYNSNSAAVDLAKRNLVVSEAGTDPEDIKSTEAKVQGDLARIENIRHLITKSSIRAPFSGVVSKQSAKVGQVVAPNINIVSVMGQSFEIESNVPEADIAKLNVEQIASVTLDAFGQDVVFETEVARIDPGETLIDNVATYKVVFAFSEPDERIRSGMTANIEVQSARKEGVLLIPVRAVSDQNGSRVVKVPTQDRSTTSSREIVTGLKSSDGQIEVLSGLSEGEIVIVGELK